MRIANLLSRELFEPQREVTKGEIIFFRLFELFVMSYVIKLSFEWGFYMSRNSEVVLPLGIANYINVSFLFDHYLALLNAAIIVALVLTGFLRCKTKWMYVTAMVLFHLQYAARFSQGEIPHSANLIGISLLCFSLGFIFFDTTHKRSRFIFGAIIFFTGLGYTSAAFTKLIGTGIQWSDGRHLWLWLAEKKIDILSRTGSFSYNQLQEIAFFSIPAATAMLTIGWITECAGFLLWWRHLRPYITTALIVFHIGITLILNIRFDAFIYELILIGYPWAALIDKYIRYIPGTEYVKT